jgi:hypothetical protein
VYAGEINPPASRGGQVTSIAEGVGSEFARGAEIGRFNMGSTVILLVGNGSVRFADSLGAGATVGVAAQRAGAPATGGRSPWRRGGGGWRIATSAAHRSDEYPVNSRLLQ